MIPLPSWVPQELWDEYVKQRKKDKKEMSLTSAKGRLKRLYELREAGHDVTQCMEEAINGHWLDFYEPREKPIQKTASAAYEEDQRRQREAEEERKRAAMSPEAIAAKQRCLEVVRRRA